MIVVTNMIKTHVKIFPSRLMIVLDQCQLCLVAKFVFQQTSNSTETYFEVSVEFIISTTLTAALEEMSM